MMPNMVASAITFFGAQAAGIVPAMINFTSGLSNVIAACKCAKIDKIYTSRKFVEKAELEKLEKELQRKYPEKLRKFLELEQKRVQEIEGMEMLGEETVEKLLESFRSNRQRLERIKLAKECNYFFSLSLRMNEHHHN